MEYSKAPVYLEQAQEENVMSLFRIDVLPFKNKTGNVGCTATAQLKWQAVHT